MVIKRFNVWLAPRDADEIAREAQRLGVSSTTLATRYLEEGFRASRHPLITFRTRFGGCRQAGLVGHRLSVADLISTIRQNENSVEATSSYLGLDQWKVEACVGYYHAYADEIDREISDSESEAERLQPEWQQRRQFG